MASSRGHLALQPGDLADLLLGPAAEGAVPDPGPERALREGLAAPAALVMSGGTPIQIDEFADVDETGNLAERALQQSASRTARSGDIDHDGRLSGLPGNTGRGRAGVRRRSVRRPGNRGHYGHPHVGSSAIVLRVQNFTVLPTSWAGVPWVAPQG